MNGRWIHLSTASILALVLSALALGGVSPNVSADVTAWSEPQVVSRPDTDVVDPELAANARGDVIAVWTRTGGWPTVESARFDPSTRTWSEATAISPPSYGSLAFPDVMIEPDGDALVVWEQRTPTARTVVARRYSHQDDAWSAIVELDTPEPLGMGSARPVVVGDADGDALAVWSRSDAGGALRSAWFDASSAAWTAPSTISQGSVLTWPAATIDGDDDVTIAWYRFSAPSLVLEAVRFDGASSTFGAVVELDRMALSTAYSPTVDLGVDGSGDVVAVFDHGFVGGVEVVVRRCDGDSGTWGPRFQLTPGPGTRSGGTVAVRADGDAIVVWREWSGSYALRSSRYTATTQTWSEPIDVGANDTGDGLGLVVLDTDGLATVVWSEMRSGSLVTRTATSRGSGGWGSIETLAVRGGVTYRDAQERIVLGGEGRVTVAWRDFDGVALALWTVRTPDPTPVGFVAVSPVRVFDTRPGESPNALRVVPKVRVGGESVLEVAVTDLAGVVPASGVGAVSLNVTATNPVAAGFVTVFPCGPRPFVSSVNFGPGATVANAVIAPVSASGSVCFFSSAPTDLVVDLNGWFPTG